MNQSTILKIENLHVSVEDKPILKGLTLEVGAGQVHAIMGPNGSGKSTLAHTLVGAPGYTVTQGSATFRGKDLLALNAETRAGEGLFLAFQYPVEIPGVSNRYFLRACLNAVRKYRGEEEVGAMEFLSLLKEKADLVKMEDRFLTRSLNSGFSGGEKKRNETLQMAILDPVLAIMDETDSGLDIDALKTVAEGVNARRRADNAFVLVTHYQRLLNYIEPDSVHVLYDGRIVRSGGKELAYELEETGYADVVASAQQSGS